MIIRGKWKEGNVLKNLLCFLLLLVINGCTYESENPKVQGARQIALIEEEGRAKVLQEGRQLLKKDADFIIDSLSARICVFDRMESGIDKSKKMPIKIEQKFKGSLNNKITYYASQLPVGTEVQFMLENGTEWLYTKEMNKPSSVYRCDYVNDER
ncbi:hypothetical protein ABID52_000432 [Fictibacillus halophilus]|uniref:Lipoprotein n=1 Tax=Fictibacillus halophilus TaxID=1610490 RepID=A0ABV2LE27_9BACL|nr:hypothetical protein [Fictibacillus halophilus]